MIYYSMRLLKMTGLWIDLAILTAILYLVSWLPNSLHGRPYFVMFRVWCRAFVRALDVDLKLHQKNRLPLPKQYILIANHPSAFEDIGIPALFDVYSLAKIEVKKWWIVGRMSEAAGTVYVNRESRDSRRDAAVELQAEISKGRNIGLYPEGGCKGRRIFENFRYGAFDASMKTGVPILPVFIHYESQDDFEWRNGQTLVDKLLHFIMTQNGTANYYVFDAIDPAAFKTKEEYTDYVWQLYIKWQEKYLE